MTNANDGQTSSTANTQAGTSFLVAAARISRLPQFIADAPDVWFEALESTFRLNGITSNDTKFEYVMSHPNDETKKYLIAAYREQNIPSGSSRYEIFKKKVLHAFTDSEESKLRKLFSGQCMGNMKPTEFLDTLRNRAPVGCNEMLLKTLFLEQLPEHARAILAAAPPSTDLEGLASLADKIVESGTSFRSFPPLQPIQPVLATSQVAAIATHVDETNGLKQEIRALRTLVDTLVSELAHHRNQQQHRPRSKSRQRSATPSRDEKLCWYHAKYGAKANKCGGQGCPGTAAPENEKFRPV